MSNLDLLKVHCEATIWKLGSVECRCRRVKPSLFQIFHIDWNRRSCFHISFQESAGLAYRKARSHQSPYFGDYKPFGKEAKFWKAYCKQVGRYESLKCWKRLFYSPRKSVDRPQFQVIKGGQHEWTELGNFSIYAGEASLESESREASEGQPRKVATGKFR